MTYISFDVAQRAMGSLFLTNQDSAEYIRAKMCRSAMIFIQPYT